MRCLSWINILLQALKTDAFIINNRYRWINKKFSVIYLWTLFEMWYNDHRYFQLKIHFRYISLTDININTCKSQSKSTLFCDYRRTRTAYCAILRKQNKSIFSQCAVFARFLHARDFFLSILHPWFLPWQF